jgi:hypothetical protein
MTKRIMLTLIGGLLAFTAGIVTTASWDTAKSPTIEIQPTKTELKAPPPATEITEPPNSEVVFADGRLRILADEVRLTSERLRYAVEVRYPQIAGSDELHIKRLNQRIRRLAVDSYQWTLNPSKADLRRYKQTFPDVFNSVDLDYEIVLANDSILSIYLNSFAYGIGAAHSVQISYVINYDLKSHRELKLVDLFRQKSRYLAFISLYCTNELSFIEPLEPNAETFASWNLTDKGIRFNFDACTINGCAGGAQAVTIPFSALKPILKQSEMF